MILVSLLLFDFPVHYKARWIISYNQENKQNVVMVYSLHLTMQVKYKAYIYAKVQLFSSSVLKQNLPSSSRNMRIWKSIGEYSFVILLIHRFFLISEEMLHFRASEIIQFSLFVHKLKLSIVGSTAPLGDNTDCKIQQKTAKIMFDRLT